MPTDAAPLEAPHAIHALMSGLIDYAGLFPPARLCMADAVGAYARHLSGPDSWMLGRFIVPVSRLGEFGTAADPLLPRDGREEPWPLSALIDGELERDLDAIFAFSAEHSKPGRGLAIIDAVEVKVPTADGAKTSAAFIEGSLEAIPEVLYPFFELAVLGASPGADPPDLRGCVAALAGADAAAKVRTGGITPDAIPAPRALAEFVLTCAAAGVPFKATAGLHHAVRADHPLTYEPGCARAVMHGFLNVFVAAAMIRVHDPGLSGTIAMLTETDPRAFTLSEGSITWRGHAVERAEIERAREQFALSYGSCSFDEPVGELRRLGMI